MSEKRKIIISVVLVAALIGAMWYVGWGRKMLTQTAATTTVKIEKGVGQEVVYARITEISGNEITYAIAEEMSEEESQSSQSETAQGKTSRGEMPQGEAAQGERPQGDRTQGGRPQGDASGNAMATEGMSMPEGGMPFSGGQDRGQSGERPGRGTATATGSDIDQFVYDGTTYRIGSETITTYIPVGTNVTTKLGTVTTFSRLAADDYVVLVMDKDGDKQIIAAVYIVG